MGIPSIVHLFTNWWIFEFLLFYCSLPGLDCKPNFSPTFCDQMPAQFLHNSAFKSMRTWQWQATLPTLLKQSQCFKTTAFRCIHSPCDSQELKKNGAEGFVSVFQYLVLKLQRLEWLLGTQMADAWIIWRLLCLYGARDGRSWRLSSAETMDLSVGTPYSLDFSQNGSWLLNLNTSRTIIYSKKTKWKLHGFLWPFFGSHKKLLVLYSWSKYSQMCLEPREKDIDNCSWRMKCHTNCD